MIDQLPEGAASGIGAALRIRFGPRIVSKLGTGFVALVALIAVGVWRVHSDLLVVLLCLLAVGCGFYFMRSVLAFAREHPGPALLEGQHLITYRLGELAAKNRLVTLEPAEDPARQRSSRTPNEEAADE